MIGKLWPDSYCWCWGASCLSHAIWMRWSFTRPRASQKASAGFRSTPSQVCFCCLLLSFSQSTLPFRRTTGTVLLSRSLLRAAGHVHSPTLRNDDLMMCFNTAMSWLDCETQGERWSLHTSWNLSWTQWNWAQRNSAKWLVHLSTMGFETRCCESQLTWTVSLKVLQDLLQAYTFHFLVDDCGLASHMWLEGTGGSRPEKLSITSSHLWLRKWYWTSVEESIG